MKSKNGTKNINQFIKISLLGAISVILMYFDFPLPFLPFPWLKIDLSDIPALMGAFAFGPLFGILIELIKNLLILVVKGTQTMFVGEFANFIIGISLIVPASFIYHRKKNRNAAILGMVLGSISMQIIGILANVYLLIPAFQIQMNKVESIKYVTVGLLPFNGIKAFLVCTLTYVLYKKVSRAIFKTEINFGEKSNN